MKACYYLVMILLLASTHPAYCQKPVPPNVVIILTDDMGYGDISCYGGNVTPTPHIDSMAKNGMRCTQYYSAAPICSPSRAGILTGMYPARWNFSTYLDNKKHNKAAEQTDYLDPKAPSIAHFFKNAGYATGHFGKWHLGGGRDVTNAPGFEQYGFDEHASTYESPDPDPLLTATNWIWSDKDSIKRWDRTAYFVDKALSFLRNHTGQPCFINLWPDDVHTPWVPRRSDGDTTRLKPEEEAALRKVLKEYDVQIGRFLAELKRSGLDKNTIVIFTSDNGPLPTFDNSRTLRLRGSKLSLYDGGTRMPFIINWTGHIKPGSIDSSSMITGLDLLPTLTGIAGIKLPDDYHGDGIDRSTVFTGKPSPRNKNMYWEYGRNNIAYAYPKDLAWNRSPQLAIRSGDWKFLMNADRTEPALYNLKLDPGETLNMSAINPDLVKQLSNDLMNWWTAMPKLK